MSASLVEAQTRPGDQILDGSRYQHLARSGERRDPRGDVAGDALYVVTRDLDLAGMEATADLNVERTDRLGNRAGATHGTCRAVEGGEKPVPKRSHFVAARPREFPPHHRVMRVEQIAPALVAQLLGPGGRTHDVGKQYGRKDAVAFCRRDGSSQKFLDCVTDLLVDKKQMIVSWQLVQSCSRDVLGKKASMFDVDERVPRAVDDQGWHMDRGQNIADIDLADHPHDRHGSRRARAKSLEAAPPLLQGRIFLTRRRPHPQTAAAAPGFIHISKESL